MILHEQWNMESRFLNKNLQVNTDPMRSLMGYLEVVGELKKSYIYCLISPRVNNY